MSQPSKLEKGFTLIEVLVSLGVILVIISAVLFNQNTYLESASITQISEEVSSSLLQAQAYGVAVKELTPGSSNFSSAYGLTFSLLGSGSNSSYLFFADRNLNTYYDNSWDCVVGGSSECLEKVNLTRNNVIQSVCAIKTNGPDECSGVSRVDVTFLRPNLEARIVFFNSSGSVYNPSNRRGARINFRSPNGLTKSVAIYESGQISVQ